MPTDPNVAAMHRAVLGSNPAHPKPPSTAFEGNQVITVVDGTEAGGVRFTVDDYSTDYYFGPAPYPRPAKGMVPPKGTKGVAHCSPNGANWYVTSLYNWP